MRPCHVLKTKKKTCFVSSMLAFICLILFSCANPLLPVDSDEEQLVKAELEDRSFRQFDPSKDAKKRKGVIVDFFDGARLWAQYAEGNTALSEWDDYSVEKSEYRISRQFGPTQCDCIKLQESPFHPGIREDIS